jgi:hypothetical protein
MTGRLAFICFVMLSTVSGGASAQFTPVPLQAKGQEVPTQSPPDPVLAKADMAAQQPEHGFQKLEREECVTEPFLSSLSDTSHDQLFKDYAACLNMDWRILKVFVYSSPKLIVPHVRFPEYSCKEAHRLTLREAFQKTGPGPAPVDLPKLQVAVAVRVLRMTLDVIDRTCDSSLSFDDKLIMLHIGNMKHHLMVARALGLDVSESSSGTGREIRDVAVFPKKPGKCDLDTFHLRYNYLLQGMTGPGRRIDEPDKFKVAVGVMEMIKSMGVTKFTFISDDETCPFER